MKCGDWFRASACSSSSLRDDDDGKLTNRYLAISASFVLQSWNRAPGSSGSPLRLSSVLVCPKIRGRRNL